MNDIYGGPEVLKLTEVERPQIGPDDILVRVHASSVTQGDRRLRAADFPGVSALFGRLMTGVTGPRHTVGGSNYAGRVVQVGSNVTRFAVGDDVFGGAMHGAYAQYLAVPANSGVAKLPDGVTYGEGAAITYGGVTALAFLRDLARVQPGERVLIVGASGGVGLMAVQIAKHLGAHVTGVCGEDAQLVRSLGADEIIDYRHEDFTLRGQTWDVIFDTTQGNHFRAYRASLTRASRYLSLYLTVRILLEMVATRLRGGPRALATVALGNPELMDDLSLLAGSGAIRAVIARRYPLAKTAEAHAFLESSRPHGSVIVDVADTGVTGRGAFKDDARPRVA
jgi:NADPH:quinone reductase-like Zn-dependent oxidoreductase